MNRSEIVSFFICLAIISFCFLIAGCGPNAKDKAVLHAAETVASGWKVLGKVDATRQNQIRARITTDPAAARELLKKHEALYKVFEKALDGAVAIIERIDREGLRAVLLGDLAKAIEEVTRASVAYENGGSL